MASQPKHKYTLEEYLALERKSETKYEFWNGEIFAMSGGSLAHAQIMGNVDRSIARQVEGNDCQVLNNDIQIKVPAAPPYRYADGSVVCGKVEVESFNGSDMLLNPILLWEVLSDSTAAYDRGDKFTWYKSIPSFREYLLIAQHRPHITHYTKQSNVKWDYAEYNDLSDVIRLVSIDCNLVLSDVYKDVELV